MSKLRGMRSLLTGDTTTIADLPIIGTHMTSGVLCNMYAMLFLKDNLLCYITNI